MGSGFGPGGSGSLANPLKLEMIKARRTQDTNTQASVLMRQFIFEGEDMSSTYNLYVSCRPSVENHGQQQIFIFSVHSRHRYLLEYV
jgi:hypothetical protein